MRWTPLHYAVMGGHDKIVDRLIESSPVRRITLNRKDVGPHNSFGMGMRHITFVRIETRHDTSDVGVLSLVCISGTTDLVYNL